MYETYEPTNNVYVEHSASDIDNLALGGIVKKVKTDIALNVGDAVMFTPGVTDTVTKTATATNHKNRFGIVVGGTKTGMKALAAGLGAVGAAATVIPAAAIGEQVLVVFSGIALAVSDAAITQYAKVKLGTTTAGRVISGTDTTDTVAGITGSILGQALDAAAGAAVLIRVLVALG